MDIDKLVENYFAPKEKDMLTKEALWELFEEVIYESNNILEEDKVKSDKAKKFVLSLPKMVPTEAWGDPSNETRKEMDKFFRAIGGGASVSGKIKFLEDLQKPETNIRSPRRIISSLILLESLSAVMNSFGSSSAGFVFEGFLAGLLGCRQVAEPEEGSLPIEDIIAFTEYGKSGGIPMSLKVLAGGDYERKSQIKGSYTNLINALTKNPAMKYIVAYKEGGSGVEKIIIKSFDLTTENFLDIMNSSSSNRKLLVLDGLSAEQSYDALSSLASWERMLPHLQRTAGYTAKKNPNAELPRDEAETQEDEPAQQLDEGKATGTQWYTNVPQLEKLGQQANFQNIGSLEISPAALIKTAEKYMDILEGVIMGLFQSVADLSTNINSYFISKQRGEAIQKGNQAIKNADEISDNLMQVTKQEDNQEV